MLLHTGGALWSFEDISLQTNSWQPAILESGDTSWSPASLLDKAPHCKFPLHGWLQTTNDVGAGFWKSNTKLQLRKGCPQEALLGSSLALSVKRGEHRLNTYQNVSLRDRPVQRNMQSIPAPCTKCLAMKEHRLTRLRTQGTASDDAGLWGHQGMSLADKEVLVKNALWTHCIDKREDWSVCHTLSDGSWQTAGSSHQSLYPTFPAS